MLYDVCTMFINTSKRDILYYTIHILYNNETLLPHSIFLYVGEYCRFTHVK